MTIFGFSFSQRKLSGEYQGIIYTDGLDFSDAQPIYFSLTVVRGLVDGKMRYEEKNSTNYVIWKLSGKVTENQLATSDKHFQLQQQRVLKQSSQEKITCFSQLNWRYDDSTGYLKGYQQPIKCAGKSFYVLLYKSEFEWHEGKEPLQTHSWVNRLVSDLKAGLSSPEKRKVELKNFQFQAVHFDYDKHDLKSEYHAYLLSVVKTVKSHSDLRIRVIGHTDSDGSNAYNERLSQRRTESIVDFLERNGLPRDRIVVEFKGEKAPVGSNKSEEGKRKNRRVDFEFY
jgi:OmpA-OmpF porin, OOP family